MENKRKVTKYPCFGYYHVNIFSDSKLIDKLLKENSSDSSICKSLEDFQRDISNNTDIFSIVLSELENENLPVYQNVGGKKIDIDVSTFRHQDEKSKYSYVYFQIANNREDAIYKKRIGEKREIVELEDDEYIGEYCNVIYNSEKRCVLLQRNKFSVSIKQFSLFFKMCISDYYQKEITERIPNFPVGVQLVADLDPNLLSKISHNKVEFQKITIKGDVEKLTKYNTPVLSIANDIRGLNGYEFTIEIKAKKEGRSFAGGLSNENIQQLYELHRCCNKEDEMQIITQMKEDDIRDVLDWSIPKRERIIPIECYISDPPSITVLFDKIRKVFENDLPQIHDKYNLR